MKKTLVCIVSICFIAYACTKEKNLNSQETLFNKLELSIAEQNFRIKSNNFDFEKRIQQYSTLDQLIKECDKCFQEIEFKNIGIFAFNMSRDRVFGIETSGVQTSLLFSKHQKVLSKKLRTHLNLNALDKYYEYLEVQTTKADLDLAYLQEEDALQESIVDFYVKGPPE